MGLTIFKDPNVNLMLMQNSWSSHLNPLLAAPINNGLILKSLPLQNGLTVVNHKLDRKLQGWVVIRKRASAEIYDAQDSNQTPQQTLILISDATVVVDLLVF